MVENKGPHSHNILSDVLFPSNVYRSIDSRTNNPLNYVFFIKMEIVINFMI